MKLFIALMFMYHAAEATTDHCPHNPAVVVKAHGGGTVLTVPCELPPGRYMMTGPPTPHFPEEGQLNDFYKRVIGGSIILLFLMGAARWVFFPAWP